MGGRSSSVGVSSTGTNWGPQARLARLRLRVGVSLGGQEDDLDQAPVATGVGGLQHERDPADAGRGRFGGLDHAPGVEPRANFDRRVLAGWATLTTELAGRTFAVVTHDAVIACLLERVLSWTERPGPAPRQPTGGWNRPEVRNGRWPAVVLGAGPDDERPEQGLV